MLVTEVLQVVLLTVIAFALGWSPQGNPLAVLLLLVLGTAAFSGLGLLMAGTLQGRGDPGRRQPGLPAAAGRRRGDRAAGQVPGRRPGRYSRCCRSRRCPTACATCSSTAPGCRGATSAILAVWAVLGLGAAARLLPLGVTATAVPLAAAFPLPG